MEHGVSAAAAAGDLHRNLLEMYAPPSVLVNDDHQIVHLSNGAERFLLVGGEPAANLLRVVHPDLRLDVSIAVYAAGAEGRDQTRVARAVVKGSAATLLPVRVTVRPMREPHGARGYFLVLFEELASPDARGRQLPAQPARSGCVGLRAQTGRPAGFGPGAAQRGRPGRHVS